MRVYCGIVAGLLCLSFTATGRANPPGSQLSRHVQYGLASWYGGEKAGRTMACGDTFNPPAMVAAHRTLPLGTRVEVTNLRNGLSVVVRIMDRGPHIANRIIDLSKGAADRLGFTSQGLTPVRVRVLGIR